MAVRKVSLTLDERLIDEAAAMGVDNLSAFVNQALDARMRWLRLGRLLDGWDAELGAVPAQIQDQVGREMDEAWAGVESGRRRAPPDSSST